MNQKKEQIYLASMLHIMNKNKYVNIPERSGLEDEIKVIIDEAEKLSLGVNSNVVAINKTKVSLLQNINSDIVSENYVIPPVKLSLEASNFPNKEAETKLTNKNLVWDDFVEELKYIDTLSPKDFGESFLNLLFRYTVNLPADDKVCDTSLYDHIKTTAAISTCLYDYYNETPNGEVPFLLIGGDMSGIQNYIYDIISKYAGKNLKGRSFYLRLLSDAIVRFLCKELGLLQANVIYNSGGSFYLLAPNVKRIHKRLVESIKAIEDKMFNVHNNKLYVAISFVELNKKTLMNKEDSMLSNKWKELFDKRDKKKKTRFSEKLIDDYDDFFEPSSKGSNSKFDKISGEEFLIDEKPYTNKEIGNIKEEIGDIREITGKQILLGKLLRETDIIIISENPLISLNNKKEFNPIDLGIYYYFLKLNELDSITELNNGNNGITIITLNGNENCNCDFARKVKTCKCIKCLQFYGGNKYNQLTFEEMCENENFHRLGVLRMDVDNLGTIFQKGIPDRETSLSKYSELSRSFDYFFSGYINTIQQQDKYKDKSFIVYSGGDDLFLVGDWKTMIDISEQIRNDFKKFTCYNKAFSISGGIAIIPDKYPIMRGAQESDNEEKNAKSHICNNQEKNSISFLNHALNWDYEFQIVKNLKDEIINAIDNNQIEKSFISKIISHCTSAKIKNHIITNVKTFWMITYDLGRMKSRIMEKYAKDIIDNCSVECCTNRTTLNGVTIKTNYHPLELWALASRWAELEMRTY